MNEYNMSKIMKGAQSMVVLKNEDDKCLKVLFYFFKLIGMAPLGLTIDETLPNSNTKRRKFTYSGISVFYNIFLTCSLIVTSVFILYSHKYLEDVEEMTIILVVIVFVSFNSIWIIGNFSVKSKIFVDICNRLSEMREIINDELGDYNDDTAKKIKITFLLQTFIWSSYWVSVYFDTFDNKILLLSSINHFICTTMVLQYSIIVKLIEGLFIKLNGLILHTIKKANNQSRELVSVVRNINNFSRLWKYYDSLRTISTHVSNFYSFAILNITLITFAIPTSAIYYMVAKPMICGGWEVTVFDYVNGTLYSLRYVYPYLSLITSISVIVDQSKKTRDIVSEFLRDERSSTIADKMTRFLMYLMNAEVQFTVFNLFPLNGSFLFAMVGTSTSYLIIIIQFQAQNCKLHLGQ